MRKLLMVSMVVALSLLSSELKAQSWLSKLTESEAVSSVVTAVTGGTTVSASSIAGTWTYDNPAVEFESDNVLKSAAASLTTSSIEDKLAALCTKAGIKQGSFSFTFDSSGSFTCAVSGKNLSGTYTIGDGTIILKFTAVSSINIGTLTAQTTLSGSTLSLLFQADALLSFISKVASVSGSDTLSAITTITDQYDGILLGFEFNK